MSKLLLPLLSGLLLALSWMPNGFFPVIFISFVPLFFFEQRQRNLKQFILGSFLAFFLFNVLTTYWIYHATPSGAFIAFLINSTLMTIPFVLYHRAREFLSIRMGYLFFICLWIAMEYLHLNWDLSWPWLTLGNVFADDSYIVQWYEFTGFLGGTLWILLVNVLLFQVFHSHGKRGLIFSILFVVIPVTCSYYIYSNFDDSQEEKIKVLIIQPNIDPYIEKFSTDPKEQTDNFIALARSKLTHEVELLLGPETALLEGVVEHKFEDSYSIKSFKELQKEFPNLNIIVGAVTYKVFGSREERTNTAREKGGVFYDAYNSAIYMPDSGDIVAYHKTKLVPGAEKMPFPYILDPIAKLVVNLGGVTGSLGSANYINSFLVNQDLVISPLICYESVYGEMGLGNTNLLAIITNDGWWKKTAGYKQHLSYAKLRAIEQRKAIVRSANTGISAIIDPRGNVLKKSEWDESVCLTASVGTNNLSTFYSRNGDYIGRVSAFFAIILLAIVFVKARLKI